MSTQTATVTAVTIVIPEAAADLGVDVLKVQWVSPQLTNEVEVVLGLDRVLPRRWLVSQVRGNTTTPAADSIQRVAGGWPRRRYLQSQDYLPRRTCDHLRLQRA
jgi:hypothetical protein